MKSVCGQFEFNLVYELAIDDVQQLLNHVSMVQRTRSRDPVHAKENGKE